MTFSIFIFFASVTTAFGLSCPEPDGSIPTLESVCNNIECPPFVSLPSRGCFETRYYKSGHWALAKSPLHKNDKIKLKKLGKAVSALIKYMDGDNEEGIKMESTSPFILKLKFKDNIEVTKANVSYYVPSKYHYFPPKPRSEKVSIDSSYFGTFYVKLMANPNEWIDNDMKEIITTYKALVDELIQAKVYDVDWKYPLVLVYGGANGTLRIELALMWTPIITPAALNDVCKSEQMPNNPECFKPYSAELLGGSNDLVEIRKYPKAAIVTTEIKKGKYYGGFRRLLRYVRGGNEDKALVDAFLPVADFYATVQNDSWHGSALILKDKPAVANPKPDDDTVYREDFYRSKFYVLPFGEKINDYSKTYKLYFQKLCNILDSIGVKYSKDLFIALDYLKRKRKNQRHEVAVCALD